MKVVAVVTAVVRKYSADTEGHGMQPLTLHSFARAIVHIDADAFFASCEQAVNPTLKGKPVVTGKERGIASAVSYEAKARGVKRGMTIREIKASVPTPSTCPPITRPTACFLSGCSRSCAATPRTWKSTV